MPRLKPVMAPGLSSLPSSRGADVGFRTPSMEVEAGSGVSLVPVLTSVCLVGLAVEVAKVVAGPDQAHHLACFLIMTIWYRGSV